MSSKEHIEKLKAFISGLEKNNKPFEIAVRDSVARQAKRIFSEGRNSQGGQIGQYDTKREMYINPDSSPRKGAKKAKGIEGLKRAGKYGQVEFKNGKKHKTAYVKNYKDFRNRIGRRIDTVNLTLSGDLKSDFSNAPIGKDTAEPRKKNPNHYYVAVTRQINADKIEGIEHKYGSVFRLTKQEREDFKKVLGFELRKEISK